MITRNNAKQILLAYVGGLILLLLAVGCTPPFAATTTPPPSASDEAGAAVDTRLASPTPPAATTPSPQNTPTSDPAQTTIQLTLWTLEEISPQAEGEAGRVFYNGLRAFEDTYPDTSVSVVIKNTSGKGSAFDYLRTASQAAPSVLPDVVVLNTVDLAQAARLGLVIPLEGSISSYLVNDLLPVARAAGTVDGQLVGIPFEMDVQHLIYNTNKVTSPLVDWTTVLSSETSYVFPAKGKNGLVNDAFLTQYLALGGRLQDEQGNPVLNEQPLRAVLDYYYQAVEAGVVSPDILNIGDPDDVWLNYVAAEIGITHVDAHRFLTDRSVLHSTQFADIPTRDGTTLAIGRGQALAIVTHDPNQQVMALRLVEWLMTPDNNATWNQTSAHIPTRYAAFDLIGEDDPYWVFLKHELEIAVPPPSFSGYDQLGRVLQQAVIEVVSGEATPEEATAAAIDAISP